MNHYEVMFIVDPTLGEEGIQSVVEKFKSMLEGAGTVETFAEWGKRRLAYPINDIEEGYYALATFTAEPQFPAELDRVFKITEGILRHLILRREG